MKQSVKLFSQSLLLTTGALSLKILDTLKQWVGSRKTVWPRWPRKNSTLKTSTTKKRNKQSKQRIKKSTSLRRSSTRSVRQVKQFLRQRRAGLVNQTVNHLVNRIQAEQQEALNPKPRSANKRRQP